MISIIIPVYRERKDLPDFLARLLTTQRVAECVVVDASPAEEVTALARQIKLDFSAGEIQYLKALEIGRAAQMNQGAAISHHPILLFLHADTVLPEGALQLIQQGMAAGHQWGRFDVRFDQPHWSYRVIASMMNWRSRLTGIATGDQAMFMRRELFDKVGGFDAIPLMEDIAMSRKLKRLDKPLCLSNTVQTAARRWQQNGVLKTIVLMWVLRLAYFLGVSPAALAKWYR